MFLFLLFLLLKAFRCAYCYHHNPSRKAKLDVPDIRTIREPTLLVHENSSTPQNESEHSSDEKDEKKVDQVDEAEPLNKNEENMEVKEDNVEKEENQVNDECDEKLKTNDEKKND